MPPTLRDWAGVQATAAISPRQRSRRETPVLHRADERTISDILARQRDFERRREKQRRPPSSPVRRGHVGRLVGPARTPSTRAESTRAQSTRAQSTSSRSYRSPRSSTKTRAEPRGRFSKPRPPTRPPPPRRSPRPHHHRRRMVPRSLTPSRFQQQKPHTERSLVGLLPPGRAQEPWRARARQEADQQRQMISDNQSRIGFKESLIVGGPRDAAEVNARRQRVIERAQQLAAMQQKLRR